jgi:hypothetical protein
MEALITYAPLLPKIRVGRERDGGYVIVNGLSYDAFISCGIGNEVSFETAFTELYPGLGGYAFDGTVDRPKALPDCMVFYRWNIGPSHDPTMTNLKPLLSRYRDVFLKMDIEGHEWNWLACLDLHHLAALKQIAIEVHGINSDRHGPKDHKFEMLKKLARTHKLVHAHGNNYPRKIDGVPTVLELTYVRNDVGVAGLNYEPLPHPLLDFPCKVKKADYSLNFWPFVFSK